ncbi:hypothetical protein H0H93_015978, partial [Arthromyces matolae]
MPSEEARQVSTIEADEIETEIEHEERDTVENDGWRLLSWSFSASGTLTGMFVGWAILSPVAKLSGWAPGSVNDMTNGARGWILWIALGIMCADSFVSLLPVLFDYVTDLSKRDKDTGGSQNETETQDRL